MVSRQRDCQKGFDQGWIESIGVEIQVLKTARKPTSYKELLTILFTTHRFCYIPNIPDKFDMRVSDIKYTYYHIIDN